MGPTALQPHPVLAGRSGARYRFLPYPAGSSLPGLAGLYCFLCGDARAGWTVHFIGETARLDALAGDRLEACPNWTRARAAGASGVGVHLSARLIDPSVRAAALADLTAVAPPAGSPELRLAG